MKAEPIVICEYDPSWPAEFAELGGRMREALGATAVRIDHIGSTSIPGLAAKPIIDIQVSVDQLEPIDPYLAPLKTLGFVWQEANPERTKRYFRETPGAKRTHIHVRKLGSWHQQFPLLFRDYLRQNAGDRNLYESTKRELAQRFKNDRKAYSESKDPVFWDIIYRADRWAADTGWEPGPSDA